MVVAIGNITLNFASSNSTYVGMGMNVETIAYEANSKLLNVSANVVNTEVSLGVLGDMKIRTNTTSNTLFTVYNNNKVILTQNNNKFLTNVNTVFSETLYTKGYAEGAKFISTSNGHVNLDLNEATKFFVKSNGSGKILNSLSITKPSSFVANRNRSLSAMMTIIDGADVRDGFWTSAGVVWPNGISPPKPQNTSPKLYSLMYSPNFPANWFGFTNYNAFTYDLPTDWEIASISGFLNPGSVILRNDGLRVNIEDSLNCGGSNGNVQRFVIRKTINVLSGTGTISATVTGLAETQDTGFEMMFVYVNGSLIYQSTSRDLNGGCAMGSPLVQLNTSAPLNYGDNLISVEFTTGDGLFHVGGFYDVTLNIS